MAIVYGLSIILVVLIGLPLLIYVVAVIRPAGSGLFNKNGGLVRWVLPIAIIAGLTLMAWSQGYLALPSGGGDIPWFPIGFILLITGLFWDLKKFPAVKVAGLVALLISFSGVLQWGGSRVNQLSTAASCSVDPAQSKCVLLKQKQAAEEARAFVNKLAEETRQAQLKAAVEAAKEAAKPQPALATNIRACGGKYQVLSDCKSIVFEANEKWVFVAKKDQCPVYDPRSAGTLTVLAKDQYSFKPHHAGVTVRFYNIPKGVTFFGQTC